MDGRGVIAPPSRPDNHLEAIVDGFSGNQARFIIAGEAEMRHLGAELSDVLRIGDVLLLHGDLGAGKTTLTQGIATGLRVQEPIQSPTFGLVMEHEGTAADGTRIRLRHLDLYRLEQPDDLESFGFDQYANPDDGITVIEWPERAVGWLPDRYLLVSIAHAGLDKRWVTIETGRQGDPGAQDLAR